jgi:hypothetical protein
MLITLPLHHFAPSGLDRTLPQNGSVVSKDFANDSPQSTPDSLNDGHGGPTKAYMLLESSNGSDCTGDCRVRLMQPLFK